jgi:RecA-family ATPase
MHGLSSGSGLSGSTAWHGAFRLRQYLKGSKADSGEQPDTDLRELEFKKNQYGPLGETIVLRYQHGLFLPEGGTSSLVKHAREAKADDLFLDLLRRFNTQGRNVSHKQNAPNYAPSSFKNLRIRKADFEAAMSRLFNTNKIYVPVIRAAFREAAGMIITLLTVVLTSCSHGAYSCVYDSNHLPVGASTQCAY